MKQTCKQNRLPIVTVVLGCCALILRRVLYAVAVDVKNLLPVNHPGNRPVGSHRDCRRVDHRFRVEAGRLGEI